MANVAKQVSIDGKTRWVPDATAVVDGNPVVGMKDDEGKLLYGLIPWKALRALAHVLTFGARTYAPNSWKNVKNGVERYEHALLRHFAKYKEDPTALDADSGLPELWHVLCNVVFLVVLTWSEPANGTDGTDGGNEDVR